MRQAVLFRVTGDFIIREPAQSVPGGNPEIAVGVLINVAHAVIRQTVFRAVACVFSVLQPGQPVSEASDPKHAIAIDIDFSDQRVEPAIRKSAWIKASLRKPVHSAARPQPQTALAILANGKNARPRQPVRNGVGDKFTIAIARQAVPGSHPEVALAVLINVQDPVAGQPVLAPIAGEFALEETAHAPVEGADPKLPQAVFVERPNVV